jgi:hypothetical protein
VLRVCHGFFEGDEIINYITISELWRPEAESNRLHEDFQSPALANSFL